MRSRVLPPRRTRRRGHRQASSRDAWAVPGLPISSRRHRDPHPPEKRHHADTDGLCSLAFKTSELPRPLALMSLWLNWLVVPSAEVLAALDCQQHTGFSKTGTPLDGLPTDSLVTYIVVARRRDGRVASSWSANLIGNASRN